MAGTTDGSLSHAEHEVGIREQSPDSRSSLAVLPMYDPEVAGLVGRRRYGSGHCRGEGRQSRRQGPCICDHPPPPIRRSWAEPETFGQSLSLSELDQRTLPVCETSFRFPVAVRAIGQAEVAVAARRAHARAAAATPRRRPLARDAPRPPELARLAGGLRVSGGVGVGAGGVW